MTSKLSLQIFLADGTSRAEVLDRESVIIGSGPSANLQIQDPGISAVHIMLKVGAEGDVTLVDLGSEQGTRLKGQVLREPTLLAAGDEVQIGGTRIKMKLEQGSNQQPAVARDVQKTSQSEDTLRTHALKSAGTASRPQEAPLSSFQSNALALGPNGNKMLNEEFSPENQPTESERELEVALFWGDTAIDVRAFRVGQSVKIGPGEECDIRLYEDIVGEGFELVTAAPGSSEPVVHVPPSGKILVYRGGEESAAPGDVRLGVTDRCLVSVGVTQLILRWVRPSKHFKSGFFESVDFYFTKVLSVVFMAHLVLLIGFWITPLNNELLSEDLFKNPNAFAKLLIRPPDKDKKPKFDLSGVKEGAKAKDKEGKFGKKDAKKDQADPSKKGAPIVDAKKREEDRAKIMKAGLLGALGGAEGAASNIFGPGGLGTGINNALGGLKGGAGMGDAHGVGGLGSRGTGPGGGGTALGIGGLGTKGSGHGAGGYGSIDLGGHGKGDTRIVPGRTIVQGALSKEIIGKVIRRHWNEIKYCYETELNKNPNLYGKVSVSFTIDGTGAVSDANVGETTMNNQNVENCMLTRVRRWTFPEPKGGGQVFVTYPWVFKAAGSEDE